MYGTCTCKIHTQHVCVIEVFARNNHCICSFRTEQIGPVLLCCPELEREKQTRQYADLISRDKSGVAISQVHHREILKFRNHCLRRIWHVMFRKLKLHCIHTVYYDTIDKSTKQQQCYTTMVAGEVWSVNRVSSWSTGSCTSGLLLSLLLTWFNSSIT